MSPILDPEWIQNVVFFLLLMYHIDEVKDYQVLNGEVEKQSCCIFRK